MKQCMTVRGLQPQPEEPLGIRMKYCNRTRRLLRRMSQQIGTALPNGDLDPPEKLTHIERRQGRGLE
jgi:hypothetical protein